jgi:hypothetical protein
MKHFFAKIYCLFFCLCAFQQAKGQAALIVLIFGDQLATEQFHLSIDMGVDFTNMPGIPGAERKLNPYFGMGTFVKLNDKWALTPEFKPLSPKGAKNTKPAADYGNILKNPEYRITANYIDVPVLLQYKVTDRLFISAGPQVSFLTSARQSVEGEEITTGKSLRVSEKVSSTFKSVYYQFPVEVGYSLSKQLGGKGVDFKARYTFGLTDMIADPSYGSSRGSSILVFLSFPFVKAD